MNSRDLRLAGSPDAQSALTSSLTNETPSERPDSGVNGGKYPQQARLDVAKDCR
jgi:hypothetical protein